MRAQLGSARRGAARQIETDSKFLVSENIMDYSLLLGVHHRAPQHLLSRFSYSRRISVDGVGIVAENESMEDEISPQSLVLFPRSADDQDEGNRLRASSASGKEEADLLLPGTARLQIQLGVNMPARAEDISRGDNARIFHEAYDVVLYLGICDILQEYNVSKEIEHAYKSIHLDSLLISAIERKLYSE